jgi:hypothetical protein
MGVVFAQKKILQGVKSCPANSIPLVSGAERASGFFDIQTKA